MKRAIIYAVLAGTISLSCNNNGEMKNQHKSEMETKKSNLPVTKGYSKVNGLEMYYEVYGNGKPLVLIHGGGSTIQSNFGKMLPMLARNRKVIVMELQAHGRTEDREKESSFEQDADDVALLLNNLKIEKADVLGFSNGATTTIQLALRHPNIIDKMILGSALYKRNGVPEQFWDFMSQANVSSMPQELKDAYMSVNPDSVGLKTMHDRDAKRMVKFKDIPDQQIQSIKIPTLIIIGDKDVIKPEHALELHRKIDGSKLLIVPGLHGEYLGEITTLKSGNIEYAKVLPLLKSFLNK
ncbi:alpha/beta fold hydrolase [Pedobacter psychroterrae]|uniref:Alpha/beta hydrolase n=1 Tax=Pedobacter psychroterrae TaxID=2530453 RepID=A0A4R0NN85_9SPHI|nr:alpha/beta hydrolase [Pedobacter psychroterrae]TCD01408.1 alpha/beta hydrolase [Pedobacter psychroterrae]